MVKSFFSVVMFIIFLSGCASKNELLMFHDLDKNNIEVNSSVVITKVAIENTKSPYVIKRYDRVIVKIYGSYENTNGTVPNESTMVDENGYAILPIVGKVKLADLTESQASSKVQRLMRKNIVDAIASVEVPNKIVYVIGDVNKPGPVKLTNGQTTLLSAISAAGGYKDSASKEATYIVSQANGEAKLTKLSMSSYDSLRNSFKMLNPGDIVYIAPNSAEIIKMSKLKTLEMIGQALSPIAMGVALTK